MIGSLRNVNIATNLGFEEKLNNQELQIDKLASQAISSNNVFTDIGSPWNVTHYANRTKADLAVSFNNNSYDDSQEVELYGWNGYQLNSTITNLYETRNWINGTFHAGPDDGNYNTNQDDSSYLVNWTFHEYDTGSYNNPMSGNYHDTSSPYSDGQDCLQLAIDGDFSGRYDVGDKCWWDTIFDIDRGDIEEAWLRFSVRAKSADQYNNHMVLQVVINDKVIWGMGLASILEVSGNPSVGNYGNWYQPYPIYIDPSDTVIFPEGLKNMNVTLEFKRVSGGGTTSGYGDHSILFDNVSLVVKSQAKPSQLELKMNDNDVSDTTNYGEGYIGILGSWNGSLQSSVSANFSSNYDWPLTYDDGGNWISYKVELDTDLNLYTTKNSPESYYTADPDPIYQGSTFTVSNNSNVNWTTYAHMEIPAGYEETDMKVEYPSDYTLTGVFLSQNPNSISQTTITEYGNKKVVNIPVSSITSNTNGFWKLTATSSNYCLEMGIYNNATGVWEDNNQFFSGDYINVTTQINNSLLVSGYIQQTKAYLQIRFPNGSIWTEKNQLKSVDDSGLVYFEPIKIPDDIPNYEIGTYNAIVTWNNSYSSFSLNETGIAYRNFNVYHNSSLIPDEYYYTDIYEGDTVNLKVSYFDPKNNKPIQGANIYLTDFNSQLQTFNEINPGYYLLIFNTSGGFPGDNDLTIYATHPQYQNNEVNITIEVVVHTNLYAEEFPSLEVPWNDNFTIHLNYTLTSDDSGIENANPIVYWNDGYSIQAGNGLYNITCNTSNYQVNTAPNLRIVFDKVGYESQTVIISVEIVERETNIDEIFINSYDCTVNKSYNIHSGDLLTITLKYNDLNAGGALIHGAEVTLNGTSIGEVFTDNVNYYNLTINSAQLDVGVSFLNIIAQKSNYTSITELLTITVYERNTDYFLYLNGLVQGQNPSIQVYRNEILNISFTYYDVSLMENVPSATVDINGSGISELLVENYNNYSVLIDTNDLNQGVNFLTLFARKNGYEPQTVSLVIEIIQIDTDLVLFVDGEDITSDPSITRYPNKILNITISYQSINPLGHIPSATVDINGSGISELLVENYENYSVLINTNNLNQGVNFLTIFARRSGYEPQTISLVIEIIQIDTDLVLFIDGEDITSDPSITRYPNEILNITVSYTTSFPVNHIPSAIVDINGSGISELLVENYENYSVLINTNDLNQGANFLTIFARRTGYEPQTISLVIEILQIDTDLVLFVDGEDITSDPSITRYPNEVLNITISYRMVSPSGHIPSAIVDINGSGISELLVENYENYSVLINTNNLNQGVNFLTIFARRSGYEPQTISLVIEIIQIDTDLVLYVNNIQTNNTDTIQVELGIPINITVQYRDYVTKNHLPGAIVNLLGVDLLNETINQYTIILGAGDLEQGITTLTIFAQLANYEPQTINFFIEVTEKQTTAQLYINGIDKTLNPVFNITIGEMLNLTLIYNDHTNAYVPNAVVQLIGEGILENFTRDDILEQHYIMLDTLEINIGVNLFSIIAYSTNYQIQVIRPVITVNRIQALINATSQITADVGDDVALEVTLIDNYFGGNILNTTVTYRWAYGQGELLDLNNDGVYVGTLENVPLGPYTITISAYGSDIYDFETREISLLVTSPTAVDLSLLVYVLIGAVVGLVSFFTIYQTHLKYPPFVRKIRKLEKKVRKVKKTKPFVVNTRDETIKLKINEQKKILDLSNVEKTLDKKAKN